MFPIFIEIDLAPVAWKAHGGYGRNSFNPRFEEKEAYQYQIKRQYRHNNPLIVPIAVHYVFYLPAPSSLSEKKRKEILSGRVFHVKRPDITNLQKFAEDTLKGIVIKDDSQVIEINAQKLYDARPRTTILIEVA